MTLHIFIIGAALSGAFTGGLVIILLAPVMGIVGIHALVIVDIRISHEFLKYD